MKKALLSLLLMVAFLLPGVVNAENDTLTVCNGTATDAYVPIYGYYMDATQHSQMLYNDTMLTDMRGMQINQLIFYSSDASKTWSSTMTVSMAIVPQNIMTGFLSPILAPCYQGTLSVVGNQMSIVFDNGFVYPSDGGNLLIDFYQATGGSYSSCNFYGVSATGLSYNAYSSSSASARSILPKVSFLYDVAPNCLPVENFQAGNITSSSVDLMWQDANASAWVVEYADHAFVPGSSDATATVVNANDTLTTLTGLAANTVYYVYVHANCGGDTSTNRHLTFRTSCVEISNLPYTENFDSWASSSLDPCWRNPLNVSLYASSQYLYCYKYDYSSTPEVLAVMPAISDNLDITTLQVRFEAWLTYSYYTSTLQVGVMTNPDDASTFVAVDTITPDGNRTEYEVLFSNYTGQGNYVAFRWVANSYCVYGAIDNLSLENIPNCVRPNSGQLINVTDVSASYMWIPEAGSNPDNYILYWSTVNDFAVDSLRDSIVVYDTTGVITGLTPNTNYYAWVASSCSGDMSNLRPLPSFHTDCVAEQVPYTMGFEGLANSGSNGTMPDCWDWISGYSVGSNPCPHGGNAHTGTVSLSMYSYGATTIAGMGNLVSLPAFDNLNTLALSFWGYQETNNPCDIFVVGVMEGTTFVPYDTISLNYDNYDEYIVTFDNYQGTGSRPALRAYRASGAMHVYLDDITVDLIPSCQKPTSIAADAASMQSTQATINWNGDASASYEVVYDTAAINDLTQVSASDIASTNSITLSGLTPGTTYHIYVRTICGSTYSDWGSGVFSTNLCDQMCPVVVEMHDSYGDGWNGAKVTAMQNGVTMGEATLSGGSNGTANINVCPGDTISFNWTGGSYPTETSFSMKDAWNNEIYSCANGSGISGTFFTWFTTCEAPSCPAPMNLTAGNIDSANAWVYWFDTVNTSWEVEYGLMGFTLGQGTTVIASADSVQLTGLVASTTYQFYVKSICSDTTVVSNPSSFTTGCGTISMYPYSIDFEAYNEGDVPNCWTQVTVAGVNPCVSYYASSHSGSRLLCLWQNSATGQNTIASPYFDDLDGKQLSFWVRNGNSNPHFSVGVIDDNGAYVPMDTITATSTWTEYTINISGYALHGNRFAFHSAGNASSTQSVYVDDVVLSVIPDCTPISDLAAVDSMATTTSITITWFDTVNTDWEYIFDTVAITNPELYNAASTNGNPLTLTGLQAAHTYHVYVRPVCVGVTPWDHVVAATRVCDQGCEVEIVMYDEYGDGWNGNKIRATQNSILMGEATLSNGASGSQTIYVCPNIPIAFNWVSGSYAYETSFEINDAYGNELYACTDGSGISGTFFTHTTNCQAPTCVAPRMLNAQSITSTSATITWFDTMASSWTLAYDTVTFAAGATGVTTMSSSVDSLQLTGLTPSTTYFVRVQANCTDTTIWSDIFSFTTGCAEINAVPWFEGFESMAASGQNGSFTQCWDVLASYYGSNPCPYGGNPNSGNNSVSMYTYSGTNTFVLPAFESLAGLQFSFYGYQETSNPCDLFTVGVINATGDYVPMDTITLAYDSYGYNVLVLDDYALIGNRVAISASRSGSMHVYLDDFTIDSISNCLPVLNLTYSNATTTSVDVDWTDLTENPYGYLIEYGQYGFVRGQGTFVNATTHPYTINGLNASTTYEFYVRALCTATDSAIWSSAGTFATECDVVVVSSDAPFFESFENANAPANCWTMVYANAGHPSSNDMTHSTTYALDGSRSFRFSSYSNGSPYDQYLVSPEFSATDSLMLSFYARKHSYGTEEFKYGYSETSNDPTDTTWVWSDEISGTSDWTQYTDVFPATAKYIGFHYYSDYAYYLYIDSFYVTSNGVGGCSKPAAVAATNVDYQGATISWNGSAASYDIAIKADNEGAFGTETAVSGNTFNYTNLLAATGYTVRVRSNCDTLGFSDWAMVHFVTDSLPCLTPDNFVATEVTNATATFTWTPRSNETQWMVKVWNNTYDDSLLVSAATATVSGLIAGNTYNAAVKAVCGNGAAESEWCEAIQFSTVECEPVTGVQVTNLTKTSATISWTNNTNGASQWRIEYGEYGYASGEETVVVATSNPYTINGLEAGTRYQVSVTAICGTDWMSVPTAPVEFNTTEGIEEVEGVNVSIYPNPAKGMTTISLTGVEGQVELTIVDMSGRRVMTENVECGSADCVKTLNVEGLAQGAYFVRINGENTNLVKKLIVK